MLQNGFALFRREQIGHADLRFAYEELLCFCEECPGNLACQVSVASVLIGEGVEDAEACWAGLEGEPSRCADFLQDKRPSGFQELCNFLFLARFCFQYCQDSKTIHMCLSFYDCR